MTNIVRQIGTYLYEDSPNKSKQYHLFDTPIVIGT